MTGEGAGSSRSLARLLDVLGSMRRVLVHGGVRLLVSHLGGRRGEVLVALSETQKEGMVSSYSLAGFVREQGPNPESTVSLQRG